jgi:hypothetical protein
MVLRARFVDHPQVLENFIYELNFLAFENNDSFLNSITYSLISITLHLFCSDLFEIRFVEMFFHPFGEKYLHNCRHE